MTPQERQLVDDLFDRLAKLEAGPRDPDAERAIIEGLRRAPNAVYALVQTVLVQDEALKRADARIQELSGEGETAQQQSSGFLDSMREAFVGRARGSVPTVPLGRDAGPDARWNQGGTYQNQAAPGAGMAPGVGTQPGYGAQPMQQGPGFGGGSFLGTAAASAAGAIAGGLLLNSISSMFGHHGGGQAFAGTPSDVSPWGGSAAGSDLSRDAGLNDVGNNAANGSAAEPQSAGLFDDNPDNDDYGDDIGGDDFGGGDDTA